MIFSSLTGLGDWSSTGFGYQACEGNGKHDKENQCNVSAHPSSRAVDCLNRDYSNGFVYVVQFMTSGKPAKENGKLSWLRDHAQAVCAKPSETHMHKAGHPTRARAHFQVNTRAHALVHAHIDSHRNARTQNARASAHRDNRAHTHTRARHALAYTRTFAHARSRSHR